MAAGDLMAAHEVPDTGHDGRGGGASRTAHPRAQEPTATGKDASALRLTLIGRSSTSGSASSEPRDGEAISLGGLRHVLIIMGILAAGLLLAFLIRMFIF